MAGKQAACGRREQRFVGFLKGFGEVHPDECVCVCPYTMV